jgi:polyvinyl alcohol dehydrogenase (cytochrome)
MAKSPAHANLPGVTNDDKRAIAGYLGGRKPDVAPLADAKLMPNQCPANPAIETLSDKPLWNGWGADLDNTRFQPAKMAGLSAAQVPNLKLKWAFGFPAAEIMWGQPTVAAGRVFIGVDTGAVYSLDADTGCVHWSFQAEAGVRNAITIAPVKGQGAAKYAAYFGDVKANVYAIDATSGKLLWKVKVEDQPVARITGAPILYEERVYVPVSSTEERAAGYSNIYACCTFRGSVVALNANTGKQLWKSFIIPDPPKPIGKTSKGVQLWGPSGGAIWDTPTVDPKNHALYIGTGDAYNHPAGKTTDAIMALDMNTGKMLWAVQDTENDAWLSGCGPQSTSENCPKDMGPDFDFGASPILRTLPGGRRILIAGQKSGMVWGHDPDKQGMVIWKAQLVDKLALGMITFGGAADEQKAYFGLRTGGVASVQISDGQKKWFRPMELPQAPALRGGQTAAVIAIPGVVFSGGWDGVVRALSTEDGHSLWEFNTLRDFKTVNGVAAKGGSIGAAGPTVAGGTLFVGSGYTFGAGTIGNVLLAFSPN